MVLSFPNIVYQIIPDYTVRLFFFTEVLRPFQKGMIFLKRLKFLSICTSLESLRKAPEMCHEDEVFNFSSPIYHSSCYGQKDILPRALHLRLCLLPPGGKESPTPIIRWLSYPRPIMAASTLLPPPIDSRAAPLVFHPGTDTPWAQGCLCGAYILQQEAGIRTPFFPLSELQMSGLIGQKIN